VMLGVFVAATGRCLDYLNFFPLSLSSKISSHLPNTHFLRHLYSQTHQHLYSIEGEEGKENIIVSLSPFFTLLSLSLFFILPLARGEGQLLSESSHMERGWPPSSIQQNQQSSLEGETPSGTECGGCLPFNISFQIPLHTTPGREAPRLSNTRECLPPWKIEIKPLGFGVSSVKTARTSTGATLVRAVLSYTSGSALATTLVTSGMILPARPDFQDWL
jgi:hypothetical protein